MALFSWKRKRPPSKYDKRVIRRFLLVPRCINDEYRWLGLEYIEQVFVVKEDLVYDPCGGHDVTIRKWVDHAWVIKNPNL